MVTMSNDFKEELLLEYEDFGEGEIYFSGILSEEIQLEMVREDKANIIYIKNPTRKLLEEVYGDKLEEELREMEAINSIPIEYQFLNNSPDDVQIDSISKSWYLIEYIDNPSEAVQLASIEDSYHHLSRIKNPTEKVQKKALGISVDALEDLRFITPVEKFNEFMKEFLSNPRVKKQYIIDFLGCYFILGDRLEFINRYGSKKAKRIAMEFTLERGL